jgi:hypothetical protein
MGAREDRKHRLIKTQEFLNQLLSDGVVVHDFVRNWMVWVYGISRRDATEELAVIIGMNDLKCEKGLITRWIENNKEKNQEETEKNLNQL